MRKEGDKGGGRREGPPAVECEGSNPGRDSWEGAARPMRPLVVLWQPTKAGVHPCADAGRTADGLQPQHAARTLAAVVREARVSK